MCFLKILFIITALLIVISITNYIFWRSDCYMPPEYICEFYKCRSSGLNFSKIARHGGTSGYDCFCLNGSEELVR